jgi:Flp pilus assembly protein TadG
MKRLFHFRSQRSLGAVLALVAIVLPAMLGMVGLVVDAGVLMSAHRQTRNAADAAAMAAARELVAARSISVATAAAQAYAQQFNGLADAQVTVNAPPATGPHAGDRAYVEVIVSQTSPTLFIQVLGGDTSRTVTGRAVAGYEPSRSGARILTLDPNAIPGLDLSGGGSMQVNGAVAVNSQGGGLDQYGDPIDNGFSGSAAAASNNSTLQTNSISIVGGVNNPNNFTYYDPSMTGTPVRTGALPNPDPFANLPPPMISNGADPTSRGRVNISGNNNHTVLQPGVYSSIAVNSGSVTFEPGIYIIRGGDVSLTVQNIVAEGVMFYITGKDYDVTTGFPDFNDGQSPPPSTIKQNEFGSVTINAGAKFVGITDPNSTFYGMLFYQRRWNTKEFGIQGNSSAGNLVGSIYTKWGNMKIAGQGTYNAQFVVGSMATTGNGNVFIDDGGGIVGSGQFVYLVE